MNLSQRFELLVKLGKYMAGQSAEWKEAKKRASIGNGWFLPEFVELSSNNIVDNFLQENILNNWVAKYEYIKEQNPHPKLIGIVMAGNIPLVGFHDFLCAFITGNNCFIKASSKDEILIKHIAKKMIEWAPELASKIQFGEIIKGCDAYIATGSNTTAGYFDYYFGKYPHLIRRNRTSVAVLLGDETNEEMEKLADDVQLYFGMGCRNVTKIYIPEGYDFIPLINSFKKYEYLSEVHKYKNNYDYNLALHLLNNKPYMSTGALLLVKDTNIFSPVSQLNYEFYNNEQTLLNELIEQKNNLQCIVGRGFIQFGEAQCPKIDQYADGEDTMKFLSGINSVQKEGLSKAGI